MFNGARTEAGQREERAGMEGKGGLASPSRGRAVAWMGLLAAVGTLASHVFAIPVGPVRVFPVQHAINVVAGVLLGPGPAAAIALVVSLLRNMLGLGTLFAFPGSIFGALLAAAAYRATGRTVAAAVGEVIGTGIIGALAAFGMARFLLGQEAAAAAFVVSFMASSAAGALIGLAVLKAVERGAGQSGRAGG